MTAEEVIDVEEYHNNLQRRSDEKWQGRYHKLKDEMRATETKMNNISHANDDLRRQIFSTNQQQRRVASLLGFDGFESIEATVTEKDPWIRGGHNRILMLETYVAELIESAKEAEAARAQMEDLLMDAQEDARRLRDDRDSARREAERQAGDARAWRDELHACRAELQNSRKEVEYWTNEVNTRLPEMQALIQAQQAKNTTQPERPCNTEKENVPHLREDHDPSILRNIVNTPTSAIGDRAMSSDCSKKKYEILQAKYDNLFASKEKISKRYFEDLKKWKRFKQWLVRDDAQNKNKQRALRRLKAMEDIGLLDDADVLHHGAVPISGSSGCDCPADDPAVTRLGPNNEPPKTMEVDLNKDGPPAVQEPNVNIPSSITLRISPPSPVPLQESLTQSSSIPLPCQDHQISTPRLPSISQLSDQIPLSQESVTQASSNPPSPVREPSQLETNVENNPLQSVPVIKTEPEDYPQLLYRDPGPSKQQGDGSICNISEQTTGLVTDGRSNNYSDTLQYRRRSSPELASAPPRLLQSGCKTIGIRRTSTILATDTPPRASALVRHHSSPPDSPNVQDSSPSVVRKGKRKAVDMEDADTNTNREKISDPFMEGPSGSRVKPNVSQTRGQKTAYGKVLGKQSHKEYMAQYMRYKGRGRYSNTASNPTVNAEFEIDPSRNGGVGHQFDAVIRDKTARKNLEASDCECCREYYEAIGPLPPRPQPPMWRSPSANQEERPFRPCRRSKDGGQTDSTPSPDTRTKRIESHKHEISRHRHDWAPTTTPPKYWNIGFPSTQEVEDINRQADDMHARKFQRVKAEANSKNGRYRRRE